MIIIKQILILIATSLVLFSTAYSKNVNKIYKSENVSNYFSGVLSINNEGYLSSYNYFKKIKGLEDNHYRYSQIYLNSLVNLQKISEAFKYSKVLERKKLDNFESNLIIFIYHLKNRNLNKAKEYALRINKIDNLNVIQDLISKTINNWINLENKNYDQAEKSLNEIDPRFEDLKKIQIAFLNCFYQTDLIENKFKAITANKNLDFSRYDYFYSNYLISKNDIKKAKKIINNALTKNPRSLILNQLNNDLKNVKLKNKFTDKFDCKQLSHSISEILYVVSNALSSQSVLMASNYYLNLAKYLNPEFTSYEALHAENLIIADRLNEAKDIFNKIKKKGVSYSWFATKRLSFILNSQNKKNDSIDLVINDFKNILNPDVYIIFDFAEFLKNNEKFNDSIIYYSKALKLINTQHPLFHEIMDGRGISYERIGEWKKAENDLLNSLKLMPDQAYVINYLAYSWIEKGINIEKSLNMLMRANELKRNDGYIIDSLGWAYFKLKKFDEAKLYLQQAVKLMPSDPVVNDHYADALWMTGKKIQARYYWNYVLQLKDTEDKLKKNIRDKVIYGPEIKS